MNRILRLLRAIPRKARLAASVLRYGSARLERLEALSLQLQQQLVSQEEADQRILRSLSKTQTHLEDARLQLDRLEAQRLLISSTLGHRLPPRSNIATPIPQLPAAGQLRASIIISTYNRRSELERTLLALRYLRHDDFEVVVVNGPSTDGTAEMLSCNWAQHVVIASCDERNLSRSRNIGIAAASGNVIVFLDDDAVPEPDWLDKLLAGYDDPKVAAVGGYARDRSGINYQVRSIVLDRFGNGDVNAPPGQKSEAYAKKMPSLLGANSSFRRDVLVAVGGFDENYAFWLDEGDVLARIVDAGYVVRQIPEAEVHHAVAPSASRDAKGRTTAWFNIAKGRVYFALRNAAPGSSLDEVFSALSVQIADIRRHLDDELGSHQIDSATHIRLVDELERGVRAGVELAIFDQPRATVSLPAPAPDRRQFQPILAAHARRRIALVTGLYPPRPLGGVAVFMKHLATELCRLGHEVSVVTIAAPGDPASVRFEDGVWVHRIVPSEATLAEVELPPLPLGRRSVTLSILDELDRVNEHRQFQWVIGALWDTDVAAAIASERYKVAVYLVTSTASMITGDPSPEQALMLRAEKWTIENCQLVLASTNSIRRDIEQSYDIEIPDNLVSIVPFGVAPPLLSDDQRTSRGTHLLFVGRHEGRKGIDLLLAILPGLLSTHPDLRVTLIGDNSLTGADGLSYWARFQELHAGAPWISRIVATGVISDEEVEAYMAQCDIFVAPSRYESFGLIYLEAMRYGKPVVGSSAGGIPEVVRNEVDGLLPPPGDAEALEAAISRLIASPDLCAQMGNSGRARYETLFTVARFAQNVLGALD